MELPSIETPLDSDAARQGRLRALPSVPRGQWSPEHRAEYRAWQRDISAAKEVTWSTDERREVLHLLVTTPDESVAAKAWFDSFQRRALLAAVRRGLSPQDADDTFQEFCLWFCRNRLRTYKPESATISAYCSIVFTNLLNKRYRDGKTREAVDAPVPVQNGRETVVELDIPTDGPTPLQQLIRQETLATIEMCIDSLPPRQRDVATLVLMGDLSPAACGVRLGIDSGAVRTALSYARAHLRKCLGDHGIGL